MSCGHGHCTCRHDAETPHTGDARHLPTVSEARSTERSSGCCGGSRHTDESTPTPAPIR